MSNTIENNYFQKFHSQVNRKANFGEYKSRAIKHVLENIDGTEYVNKESLSDKEGIELLVSEFERTAIFENNIIVCRRAKKDIFIDYLMGLPSFVTFEFNYCDIYPALQDIYNVNCDHLEATEANAVYYMTIKEAVKFLCIRYNINFSNLSL